MTAKRKPPTRHQKKQEGNKKAVLWVGLSVSLVALVMIVLLIVNI